MLIHACECLVLPSHGEQRCMHSKHRFCFSSSLLLASPVPQGCHTRIYVNSARRRWPVTAPSFLGPGKALTGICTSYPLQLSLGWQLPATDTYSTILRGLLRSHKFLKDASKIPCDIVQTLENDADAAKTFVTQLEQGHVPDLIADLPQEVIESFNDVVNIAASLPTEILDAAQSVVTDAVNVFNDIEDGSIVSDLAKIPGIVVSDITAGWGDFTSGLVEAWDDATSDIACFFGDCPTSTTAAGSCAMTTSTAGYHTTSYVPATTTDGAGGLTYSSAYHASLSEAVAQSASVAKLSQGNASVPTSAPKSEAARQTSPAARTPTRTAPFTRQATATPEKTVNSSSPAATNHGGSSAVSAQSSLAGSGAGFQSVQIFSIAMFGALGLLFC